MNVEKTVTKLVQADQVTQQSLDDMLCHTPAETQMPIMQWRTSKKTSRRSLKPLQLTLLYEWEKLRDLPFTTDSKKKKKLDWLYQSCFIYLSAFSLQIGPQDPFPSYFEVIFVQLALQQRAAENMS